MVSKAKAKALHVELEEERDATLKRLQTMGELTAITSWDGRADVVDLGSAAIERVLADDRAGKLKVRLSQILDALKKLDDGGYGTCEVCEAKIDDDRLEALPWTPFCREHAGG